MIHHRHQRSWKLPRLWQSWRQNAFLLAALSPFPTHWPRWAVMWSLALAIYSACKWLTWQHKSAPKAPWWKHAGYLFAWPGMDAEAFLNGECNVPVLWIEWLFAGGKLAFGIVWLFAVIRWIPTEQAYVIGWAGMFGMVLVLHFGLFHLLSCFWRSCGVDAKPLMHWPLASTSVSEFWGRRWNTAFRDLTHRFLFRPLTAILGPRRAIVAGFFGSGVIHDLVISLPASGGYGGPTVYFLLQCAALFAERSKPGRTIGLGRGLRGWLFTLLVLLLPAPLLFHPPFILQIVVPFLRAMGAIS
jgi:Membrane bound O-acyl transferase family